MTPDQFVNIPYEQIFGQPTLTSTGSTSFAPWMQDYAKKYLANAWKLANGPAPIAPFNPAEIEGMEVGLGRARSDRMLLDPMNEVARRTLMGGYMDPASNPWLRRTFDTAAGDVTNQYMTAIAPTTAGMMNRAGIFGGSAHLEAKEQDQRQLGATLSRLGTEIYGGNYQRERDKQFQEQDMIANLLRTWQVGPDTARNIGSTIREQEQAKLMWPYQASAFFGEALGGLGPYGSKTTSTQPNPNYQSPFQTFMGMGAFNQYPGFGLNGYSGNWGL